MRLLQVIFSTLWGLGYLGNGILFLYIEWSFLRQSFVQIFNPFLHLQVFGVLITTPLFWVFLAMAMVGYYAANSIEGHLKRNARQPKIDVAEVVSPLPQTLQERQPNPLSSSIKNEQIYSSALPQSFQKPVSEVEAESVEPKVKLLEWAIQSSQKVRFSYEKRNGEKSNRTITPINFKTVGQTLCLEGYCNLRRAKRTFAIKRMQDIIIISASEAKSEYDTSQEIRAPYIDIHARVNSASQPLLSSITSVENTNTQVKQRPYIKYHIDEIERIAALEWNDTKVLNEIYYELEFRSRKKALDLRERIVARLTQLQSTQFSWSTTANPGSQNLPSVAFKYEEGLLRHYGYKVGMNGLPESERWEILDTIFLRPLLQMDNAAYLSEWGEPRSAKRLQKLADSIAAFTRNAKRRSRGSFSKAIQDWETDLAYLRRTYYNNHCSFQYPRT